VTASGGRVLIHYHRLPDHTQVFDQAVVDETDETVVTLAEAVSLPRPVLAGDDVILEPGAPVVWFTFPGAWHDIGRFHLADGTFTGYYANILTPPEMEPGLWRTTDLCLDVWLPVAGPVQLLDEDEFEDAVRARWLDAPTAARARSEAARLVGEAERGVWPPPPVRRWTLGAARARLGSK
jgi:predicted RNA-binding protein associated with RNAse of E/G family